MSNVRHEAPLRADVIVVGSGFGGAVAACRLAQAGFSVLLLERGRRITPQDFPPLPADTSFAPSIEPFMAASAGVFDYKNLGRTRALQANGYGGGSLIYAGVHLRPPPDVLDAWPEGLRSTDLSEHFDLAAWMLDVAPIDDFPFPLPEKTKRFERSAAGLGRTTFRPPLTHSRHEGKNAFGVRVRACIGCGACVLGCRHGAKNSLDQNYLALAEQYENFGCRTRAEVVEVNALDEGYSVEFIDGLCGGERREAHGRYVFLCAGVFGTHGILARSRESAADEPGRGLAHLSPRLGAGFFTNNDDTSLVLSPDASLRVDDGPTITSSLAYHPPEGGVILIQDGGQPAELARFMAPIFASPAYLGRNRHGRRAGRVEPRSNAPGLADELESVDLPHSGVEQLVVAWLAGELPDVVPRQLRLALSQLRSQLIEQSRPNFTRAIDQLLVRFASTVVDRLTLGQVERFPRLRDRLVCGARQLGERLLIDRDALVEQAQDSFFRFFLANEPRAEVARRLEEFHRDRSPRGQLLLLSMGTEADASSIRWHPETGRLSVTGGSGPVQDNAQLARRAMRDIAAELGAELRTHPFSTLANDRMTVHAQGGATIGSNEDEGVVDDSGEVFGHPGLFIFDASIFPSSVGVNPSATILALAERNALAFIRSHRGAAWPLGDESPGARQFHDQTVQARSFARHRLPLFASTPPGAPTGSPDKGPRSLPIGLTFAEKLSGAFFRAESSSNERWQLELRVHIADLDQMLADPQHPARVSGVFDAKSLGCVRAPVRGRLLMHPAGLDGGFRYELQVTTPSGETARLQLDKRMKLDEFRAADLQSATMHSHAQLEMAGQRHAGRLDVDAASFLTEQLPGLEVTGTDEPTQIAWAMLRFGSFFARALLPDSMNLALGQPSARADHVVTTRAMRRRNG